MANKELITCDYEGCDKAFAYRLGPFNLCYEHVRTEEERRMFKLELMEMIINGRKRAAVQSDS